MLLKDPSDIFDEFSPLHFKPSILQNNRLHTPIKVLCIYPWNLPLFTKDEYVANGHLVVFLNTRIKLCLHGVRLGPVACQPKLSQRKPVE